MPPKKQQSNTNEENLSNEEKLKRLDTFLTKMHGDSYYGKSREMEKVNFISSGCYSLDQILGGGIAEGRIIELPIAH